MTSIEDLKNDIVFARNYHGKKGEDAAHRLYAAIDELDVLRTKIKELETRCVLDSSQD